MQIFQKTLAANIKQAISRAKRDGTVGMSVDNLRQVTKTPMPFMAGSPSSPQGYQAVFAKVVATINIKGFNIYT